VVSAGGLMVDHSKIHLCNRMSQKLKNDYLDLNMSVYEKGVLPRVRIFTLEG